MQGLERRYRKRLLQLRQRLPCLLTLVDTPGQLLDVIAQLNHSRSVVVDGSVPRNNLIEGEPPDGIYRRGPRFRITVAHAREKPADHVACGDDPFLGGEDHDVAGGVGAAPEV